VPFKLNLRSGPLKSDSRKPAPIDVGQTLDRLFWELGQINRRIAQIERHAKMCSPSPAACRERTLS